MSTQGDLALLDNEEWNAALPKVRRRLLVLEELLAQAAEASEVADADGADRAISAGGGWQTCGLSLDVTAPLVGDMVAGVMLQLDNATAGHATVRVRLRVEGSVKDEELYWLVPPSGSRVVVGQFYQALAGTVTTDTVEVVLDSDVAVTVKGTVTQSELAVSSWVGNFLKGTVYDPTGSGRVTNASNLSNGSLSVDAATVYGHTTPGQAAYNAFHNVARTSFPSAPVHGTRVIRTDHSWPNEYVARTDKSRWVSTVEREVLGFCSGNLVGADYLSTIGSRKFSATLGVYADFSAIYVTGARWAGTAHADGTVNLRSGGTDISGASLSVTENVNRTESLGAALSSAGVLSIHLASGTLQNGTVSFTYRRDGGAT